MFHITEGKMLFLKAFLFILLLCHVEHDLKLVVLEIRTTGRSRHLFPVRGHLAPAEHLCLYHVRLLEQCCLLCPIRNSLRGARNYNKPKWGLVYGRQLIDEILELHNKIINYGNRYAYRKQLRNRLHPTYLYCIIWSIVLDALEYPPF